MRKVVHKGLMLFWMVSWSFYAQQREEIVFFTNIVKLTVLMTRAVAKPKHNYSGH